MVKDVLVLGPSRMDELTHGCRSLYGKAVELPLENNIEEEEKEFIRQCAKLFDVDLEEKTLTSFFSEKEDFSSISKAFSLYRTELCKLTSKTFFSIESEIEEETIIPLCKEELVDVLARVTFFYDETKKRRFLWKNRIPYVRIFNRILKTEEDLGSNFDLPLVFSHFAEEFRADQRFFFIARACSDMVAASIVFSLYPYWIKSGKEEMYVFDDLTGKWNNSEGVHFAIIARYSSFLEKEMPKSFANYGDTFANKKNLHKELKNLERLYLISKAQFEKLKNSSLRKVLFKNGFYDGNDDIFIPRIGINISTKYLEIFPWPHIMFFGSIPDNYLSSIEGLEEIHRDIYKTLFLDMHSEEMATYRIENIAIAMLGITEKKFYINLGETNTGKSTEINMIGASLGDLVGKMNLNKLKYDKNDSRDSGMMFTFVWDLWMKRIILSSEGGEFILNGEICKAVVSGGLDEITARTQYERDALFNIHFTLFVYNNFMLKFNREDKAINDRAVPVPWTWPFVENVTDPTSQKQARAEVKLWPQSEIHRQIFVFILLQGYRSYRYRNYQRLPVPQEIQQALDGSVFSGNTEATVPLEMFQKMMMHCYFHGDSNKFITLEELKKVYTDIGEEQIHASRKMNKFLETLPFATIKFDQKRIRDRNVRILRGVSLREGIINTPQSVMTLTNYEEWLELMNHHNGVLDHYVLTNLTRIAGMTQKEDELTDEEKEFLENNCLTVHYQNIQENYSHLFNKRRRI